MKDLLQGTSKIQNSSKLRHLIKHLQSSKTHKTHQGPQAVISKSKKQMTLIIIMDKSNSSSL